MITLLCIFTCRRGNYLWLVCVRTLLGWILTSWVFHCTAHLSTRQPGLQRLRYVSNTVNLMKILHASHELTGNGSAPSWMTKPSMRCVRTLGLTTAWGGGPLSPCEIPRDPESTKEEGEETGGGAPKSCEGKRGGGMIQRNVRADKLPNLDDENVYGDTRCAGIGRECRGELSDWLEPRGGGAFVVVGCVTVRFSFQCARGLLSLIEKNTNAQSPTKCKQ